MRWRWRVRVCSPGVRAVCKEQVIVFASVSLPPPSLGEGVGQKSEQAFDIRGGRPD